MVKDNTFSPKIRNKSRMSILTITTQRSIGNPSQCNKTREGNRGIQIRKEKIKLSLFADDMFVCMDNPKEFTKTKTKLLEVIN